MLEPYVVRMPAVSNMSLTASLVPGAGRSISVMKMWSGRAPGTGKSVRLLQPRPRHLPLDHRRQQPLDLLISHHPHVAVIEGLAPIEERPLLGEMVEVGAGNRDLQPRVLRLALAD